MQTFLLLYWELLLNLKKLWFRMTSSKLPHLDAKWKRKRAPVLVVAIEKLFSAPTLPQGFTTVGSSACLVVQSFTSDALSDITPKEFLSPLGIEFNKISLERQESVYLHIRILIKTIIKHFNKVKKSLKLIPLIWSQLSVRFDFFFKKKYINYLIKTHSWSA